MMLATGASALATPSQSDVFKSIQDNVSTSGESDINPTPWICAGIGVIIVLALFSKRQSRQSTPKVVSHTGRLMKEIMKKIPLRAGELRQLKILADEKELPDGQAVNPLVLLLCPSVVIKSVNERSTKADRRTLVGVLRKMGIR
ncbi:MAG TPA: hypothetical protein VFE47_03655 [Tepidisphaeraceae bacterium]|nr:hypothetical protein [Tepidisphaeraceae bacterium]